LHVFVSDLHLTDGSIGDAVSAEELIERLLLPLSQAKEKPVQLVLLGDIFELLRSTEWERLWRKQHPVAPWTAMSRDFVNFSHDALQTSVGILRSISNRYSAFAQELNRLTASRAIQAHYVPGNHDFMVQLSVDARKLVRDFLTLDIDPMRPFDTHYRNAKASLYATHGNSVDSVNWHEMATGRWAFGDAVVLRLVNSFVTEACEAFGQQNPSGGSPIAQAFQDLDNVQPIEDLPVYFRFILDAHLTNKPQKDKVLEFWRKAVEEVLSLPEFQDEAQYGDRQHNLLKTALKLSTDLSLTELVTRLHSTYASLFGTGDPYLAKAQHIFESLQGSFRFVIFGHTHQPHITPLDSSIRAFYVNTGCWRPIVSRRHDLSVFRKTQVRSAFAVENEAGEPIYRLLRETEIR
jgi:UDP-2,3-diacylglucosamine pyrophosphatase LpxH